MLFAEYRQHWTSTLLLHEPKSLMLDYKHAKSHSFSQFVWHRWWWRKQLMKLCMNQNQQHVLPLCIKAFNNFLQTTTHIVQHAQHLSCDDISSSTWPIWPSVGSCLSDIAYCRLQLTQTRSAMWVCPGQFQAPPDTSAWGWPTIWCCNTCTTCLPSAHTKTQMCTNCLESERCKFCHPVHMPTEENSQYR